MNKYLHHYTNIQALEAILKNKTIRFTNLSKVDDPDEGQSSDLANIGRFVFISCWTETEERYTMWDSRYADYLKGVRISLPRFPFERYKVETGKADNGSTFIPDGNYYYSFIPNSLNTPSEYVVAKYDESNFLVPIEYTEDQSLLNPNIFEVNEEVVDKNRKCTSTQNKTIRIEEIGRCKNLVWEDQRELRYRFYVSPYTYTEMQNASAEEKIKLYNRFIDPNVSLPFDHIDLKIDNNFYGEMIITTGPKISDEDYKTVMRFIAEFNPMAQIEKSKVRVR